MSVQTGQKHTEGYNWSYARTNSKGEVILRHDTGEDIDDVLQYLDSLEGVTVEPRLKAHMLFIGFCGKKYSYYYTTGRWAERKKTGYPTKHYRSKNIEHFMTTYVLPLKEQLKDKMDKVSSETYEDLEDLLKNINHVKENNTLILISKDGRKYKYRIGTGKWSAVYDNNSESPQYQSAGFEYFLMKYFPDTKKSDEELKEMRQEKEQPSLIGEQSSNRKGDFAEYYAVTWLWDNGYDVFKNCGCSGIIDMIAWDKENNKMIYIDVKTAQSDPRYKKKMFKVPRTKEQVELGVQILLFDPETRKLRFAEHKNGLS